MSERLHAEIDALASFNSDPGAGGITREVYTPEYREAEAFVATLMRDAGLAVRVDAAGNLIGRWDGAEPGAPAVLTGSHFDTTLNAGRYDGVVGVLGAIEAVHALRAEGVVPRRSIEVIGFAGEEPRFVTGCVGSRAMAGELSRADLDRLTDRDGVTMARALSDAGLDPDRIGDATLEFAAVHAFVELHIEQGGVLEDAGQDIGVVTAIAAPHDVRIVVRGSATHAGATPMGLRADALLGAAEIALAVERLAIASPSDATVGTVGVLRVRPGAINVVPGEVELELDVRDSDRAARDAVVADVLAEARAIAQRRGLTLETTTLTDDTPARCSDEVVAAGEAVCASLGLSHRRMVSGAFHDAMVLGAHVPIGMLFVPSRDGLSHHPDEYTSPEQIDAGVRVLAGVLARLSA